jgi:hypothetical protein
MVTTVCSVAGSSATVAPTNRKKRRSFAYVVGERAIVQ